jgi:hypothetical protein
MGKPSDLGEGCPWIAFAGRDELGILGIAAHPYGAVSTSDPRGRFAVSHGRVL